MVAAACFCFNCGFPLSQLPSYIVRVLEQHTFIFVQCLLPQEELHPDFTEMTPHDLDLKLDAVIRGNCVVFFEERTRRCVCEKKSGGEICLPPLWTATMTVS